MADIVYCDFEAQDDPRFQYAESTFAPPPGVWAPACGHEACVTDDKHCTSSDGWHDWDCPVATCRWDTARKTCDFPKGHAGDHSYALHELPVLWPKPACAAWYEMLEAAQSPAPALPKSAPAMRHMAASGTPMLPGFEEASCV